MSKLTILAKIIDAKYSFTKTADDIEWSEKKERRLLQLKKNFIEVYENNFNLSRRNEMKATGTPGPEALFTVFNKEKEAIAKGKIVNGAIIKLFEDMKELFDRISSLSAEDLRSEINSIIVYINILDSQKTVENFLNKNQPNQSKWEREIEGRNIVSGIAGAYQKITRLLVKIKIGLDNLISLIDKKKEPPPEEKEEGTDDEKGPGERIGFLKAPEGVAVVSKPGSLRETRIKRFFMSDTCKNHNITKDNWLDLYRGPASQLVLIGDVTLNRALTILVNSWADENNPYNSRLASTISSINIALSRKISPESPGFKDIINIIEQELRKSSPDWEALNAKVTKKADEIVQSKRSGLRRF